MVSQAIGKTLRLEKNKMINILFFGQLKEQLRCDNLQFELQSSCSVASLLTELQEKSPLFAKHLANDKLMMAVNQTMVSKDHQVNDGDEVAFFPPVTGG